MVVTIDGIPYERTENRGAWNYSVAVYDGGVVGGLFLAHEDGKRFGIGGIWHNNIEEAARLAREGRALMYRRHRSAVRKYEEAATKLGKDLPK